MIVAVEGIDGAGKHTLVTAIARELGADTLAFPRYDDSVHAQLAQEALHGRMGDLTDSAYAMATLFALDRFGAKSQLESYAGDRHRIIILDRYVASNAAYSVARTQDPAVSQWVYDLEFGRLGLPLPDLHVLVDTSPEIARDRAAQRERDDDRRTRDRYERDASLQQRTFDAYVALAEAQWASRWVRSTTPAVTIQEVANVAKQR